MLGSTISSKSNKNWQFSHSRTRAQPQLYTIMTTACLIDRELRGRELMREIAENLPRSCHHQKSVLWHLRVEAHDRYTPSIHGNRECSERVAFICVMSTFHTRVRHDRNVIKSDQTILSHLHVVNHATYWHQVGKMIPECAHLFARFETSLWRLTVDII